MINTNPIFSHITLQSSPFLLPHEDSQVKMPSHTHYTCDRGAHTHTPPHTHRGFDTSILPPVITSLATTSQQLSSPPPPLASSAAKAWALTGPGRLALSGPLGIRVDAGSGPGAGDGSGNRRCRRRRQRMTQIRSERLVSLIHHLSLSD